jgi:predicted PurR-regulated permease PerM
MDDKDTTRFFDALIGDRAGTLSTDRRLRALVIIICYMIIGGGVFLGLSVLSPLIHGALDVATPFILAFILAYILNPVLRSMQRRFNLTRPGVVLITYITFGGVVISTFIFLLPLLYDQGKSLINAAEQMREERLKQRQEEQASREVQRQAAELAKLVQQTAPPSVVPPVAAEEEESLPLDADEEIASALEIMGLPDLRALAERAVQPNAFTTETLALQPLPAAAVASSTVRPLASASQPPAPRRVQEDSSLGSRLRRSLDKALDSANARFMDWWEQLTLEASMPDSADSEQMSVTKTATTTSMAATVGTYLGSLLLNFISTTIMLSFVVVICFYMLVDYTNIIEQFWRLVPVEHHERWARVLAKIDYSLGGFLRGQLTICFILGLVWAFWLMFVMGLVRYALLVAVIAGTFNFIPYLGPAIGGIAASAYVILAPEYHGFMEKLGGVALALLGLAIVQFLEGFVLQPKLIGSKAQLHPLLIMLALIAGGQFGFAGLLLAVPVACVFKVLWSELFWEPYVQKQRVRLESAGEKDFAASAMRVFTITQDRLIEDAEIPPGSHMVVKKAREYLREFDSPRHRLASSPSVGGLEAPNASPALDDNIWWAHRLESLAGDKPTLPAQSEAPGDSTAAPGKKTRASKSANKTAAPRKSPSRKKKTSTE